MRLSEQFINLSQFTVTSWDWRGRIPKWKNWGKKKGKMSQFVSICLILPQVRQQWDSQKCWQCPRNLSILPWLHLLCIWSIDLGDQQSEMHKSEPKKHGPLHVHVYLHRHHTTSYLLHTEIHTWLLAPASYPGDLPYHLWTNVTSDNTPLWAWVQYTRYKIQYM